MNNQVKFFTTVCIFLMFFTIVSTPGFASVNLGSAIPQGVLVARGIEGDICYRLFYGPNWSDWNNIAGSTSTEPAVAIFQGKLYIAIIDESSQIEISSMDFSTRLWSDWSVWQGPNTSSITFAASADKLAIVARGVDGSIWYRIFDGSTWTDWTHIIASTTIAPAAAIYQNQLYIAAIDGSTHIWLSTVDLNTQVWSGWTMWQNTYSTSITFAASADKLAIVARSTDNTIWYRVNDGLNWNSWTGLIGTTTIEPTAAIFQEQLYIAAIDGASQIWLSTVDLSTQVWSGWTMWPNTCASSVTLASSGITSEFPENAVPELPLGALSVAAICLFAFAVFYKYKKNKNLVWQAKF